MGWTDDHRHQQMPSPSFKTKPYLWDGPTITNTDRCLIPHLKLNHTYGMDQ